jgi:outer membrane lipoprotein carrier protein
MTIHPSRESRRAARPSSVPLLLACFVLCAVASARQAARATPAVSIGGYIHQFESSYLGVRSLRAEFTQSYVTGGRTRVESGTVYFARGGLMRWDYRKPQQKLFISDGKKLLLYIPEEKQLTRSSLKSSEDVRVPFRLLLSRLNLRRVFARIEFLDAAWPHDPADRVLRAFPKREYEGDYREVIIESDSHFDIRRLKIFYPDGSSMEFRFDHLVRNATLNPAVFEFTPPAGTEIIDEH